MCDDDSPNSNHTDIQEAQRKHAVASSIMPTPFPPLTARRNNVVKEHETTETYRSRFSCSDLHKAACRDDALFTAIPTYAWAKLLKVYTGSKDDLVFDCILPQDLDTADTSLPFPLVCSFDAWEQGSLTLGHAVHEFSGHLVRGRAQQRRKINGTVGKEDQQHLGTLLDLGHLSESSRDRGLLEDAPHGLPNYAISISIEVPEITNGLLLLTIFGRGGVINEEAAQLLLAQYDLLLGTLIRYPDKSIHDIFANFSAPLLSISNPQTSASIAFPDLHSQFHDVAKATPQEIALEFWTTERSRSLRPDTMWTYAELDRRAGVVAAELQSRFGFIAGCIVPICMDRCPEIYATILGILKAGGAWCPIDPSFPSQRRHDLIARTDAKALVLNTRSPQDGIPKGVAAVELSRIDWNSPGSFRSRQIDPDSLAYLIWTSGTTGAPKGVPISHQAAMVSMTALRACIPMDVKQNHIRCLQFSQFTFDVFVQDLFYTWGAGGTLISADRDTMLGSFSDLATKSRATHAHLTPAFAASVLRKQCPTLEVVTMIGEKLTQNVADDWSEDCRLYNTYGPAEATVVATLRLVPHGDVVQSANVGVPMPSVSAFVIHDGEVVMRNGIGELALGGPQLSGGYWKDYTKTKERFVWNDRLQTTLYMTGDIVRQLYNGTFEFVGRTDDLIKIQGIRVELSEIAFSLRSCHSHVQQVEVFFLSRPDRPSKVIVAFLATPTVGDCNREIIVDNYGVEVAQKALEVAKTQLPDYMIPSIFLVVAKIPRTSSAKVDRLLIEYLYAKFDLGAWEEKLGLTVNNGVVAAALDPHEVMIVEIISNITGTSKEAMRRHSTLPSIGVDSITATRLAAKLRIQGYAVSVTDIVQCSNLDDLFQSSRKGNSKTTRKIFDTPAFHQDVIRFLDPDLAKHVEVVLPALPLQESLLYESFQDPSAYWSNKLFELDANIDLKRLERAWMNVAQSTDALRATFHPVADVTNELQVKTAFLQLVHVGTKIDWTTISSSESAFETRAKDRARELAERRQARQFTEPLWAVTIILVASRTIMMLSIHHAIRDEPSLGIIMNDVEHAYMDNAARLLQQRHQLRDAVSLLYIADVDQLKRHEQFWSDSLSNFNDRDESKTWPELKLADDGRMKGTISYCWDAKDSYKSLRVRSATIGAASLASVLRVVWGCVLLEYLETDKVVYGETWSARGEAPELSDLVAPLVFVFPVPFQAHGTWREALRSTTNFQQQSRAYHGVHPRSIRKMLNRSEGEALYPAIFNFVPPSAEPTSNDTSSLWREVEDVIELSFEHAIALNAAVSHDDTLRLEMTALKSCIDKEHLHILGRQIDALLEIILDSPDWQRSQLFNQIPQNLLSVEPLEEKSIVNHAWKEPPTKWVDHNAATHPNWNAAEVVSSLDEDGVISQRWSYEQLHKAYRNVARFISEAGCRRRMIGVCLERCLDVYAVVLGIMWTGNIYLPIANDLPEERKMFLLKDSDAAVFFTSKSFSSTFPTACRTVFVEDLDYSKAVNDSWTVSLSPTDDAYLLYTSGSTGSPKGVLVSRGNLTSFIEAISHFIRLHMDMIPLQGKGKWLGMASYAFDVHLLEMFFAWRHGMATVTAARSMLLDNLELALQQLKVTHASFVPSLVDNAGLEPARLPDLRYMSLGGEKISKRAINTWSRSHVVLANAYGPTEATIGCCFRRVEPTSNVRNIGYPLPYTVAHVLRPDRMEYVLRGISGELCLTGDLVATGYLNRPEAKGFVDDFHGRKMYRTGDQVRLMSDGSFEFLGRQDDQTKIRGQRIELGEVSEAVRSATRRILDIDLIEVASLVIQHPALTRPQLVSFISIQEGSRNTADKDIAPINFPKREAVEEIRMHCRRTLPSFMVPDHLIRLRSLPIVPTSRKVDMKRLGALFKSMSLIDLTSSGRLVSTSASIPSKTEIMVRRVVIDVLELKEIRVDADRNLFQFGLDSLNVINLTIKLQKEGLGCTVSKLLRNPTIRAISQGVTQRENIEESTDWPSRVTDLERNFRGKGSSNVNLVNIAAIRPCLPLQETMVASSLDNEGEALYINHVLLELSPDVDHQRLMKAWAKTAVDNEVLRTCFCDFENHFVQLVLKVAPLSCNYMYTYAADDGNLDLRQRKSDIGFDIIANIGTQPPVKLTVVSRQWPGHKGLLLVSLHHALYDVESFSMLLDEVYTNYQGMKSLVARTPITALINHIESRSQSDARMFWTRYLAGYSPSSKPQSTAKGQSSSMTKEMVTPLADLERFATSMNGTLASVMQALVGIVLAEKAQTQDLVFGTILSGRTVPVKNPHTILAPCIATIPQRVQINYMLNLRSVVSSAQKGFVESIEHQHTALRDIHRWVEAETPLFDSLFTYTRRGVKASWSHLWSEVESSMSSGFPLAVEVVADQVMNRVVIRWDFTTASETLERVNLLADRLQDLLQSLVQGHHVTLDAPQAERSEERSLGTLDGHQWTGNEMLMRDIISSVVGLDARNISRDTAFFALIRTFESTLFDILEAPDKPVNGVFSDPPPSLLDQSPGSNIPDKSGIDVRSDTLETVRRLLEKVSGITIKNIANGASIFSLGLDSISAIQIAAEARKERVKLSVADVLQGRTVKGISQRLEQSQNKRLATNGQTVRTVTGPSHKPAQDPLSLQVSNDVKSKVLALAGLRVDDAEDVLPCLAGQYFHLMTWLKFGRTRGEGTFTYRCKDPLDPNRLLKAWRTLRERHPILRTVFISISATEVMQAVLRPAAIKSDAFQCIDYWPSTVDTTGTVVKQIAACRFDVFSPPVELSLAQCTAGYDHLALKLHHALYDAWTISKIADELGALYEGRVLSPIPRSTSMIQDIICSSVSESSQDYWRKTLAGCQGTMLTTANQPATAVREKQSRSRTSFFFLQKAMPDLHQLESRCHQSDASLPRVILLAFGRSLAELTAVKSPTFGLYHTGRSSHVEELTKSCLPCMNMTPLMVHEPLTRSVRSSVEDLEIDLAARMPFEQSNLYDIFEWIGWGRKPLFNTFVNILWRRKEADTRSEEDKTEALFSPWEAGNFEDLTPSLRLPGRTGVDGLDTSFLVDGNLFLDVQRYGSEDELRLSVRCDFEVLCEEEARVFLERIGEEIGKCVEERQRREVEE